MRSSLNHCDHGDCYVIYESYGGKYRLCEALKTIYERDETIKELRAQLAS